MCIRDRHAAIADLQIRLEDEAGARESLRRQAEELAQTNETLEERAVSLTEQAGVCLLYTSQSHEFIVT